MRIILLLLVLYSGFVCANTSQPAKTNLILVTIDGVRWQEVFRGADQTLINEPSIVKNSSVLKQAFWRPSAKQRREALMPFFWQTIAKQGVVAGNRDIGSTMRVANPWFFSYPGYNEIITGKADPHINSNDKIPNANISFIEWLNNQQGFSDAPLAVFGSWDVFPAIFNRNRSQLHINAGFESETPVNSQPLSTELALLNEVQSQTPSPWETVRLDVFTYQFAKHYLLTHKPRVMMLALGEPDDFAHDGNYSEYLHGIHRADKLLADLWHTVQNTEGYKNNTVMLITTDHGRGSTLADWAHHSSKQALAKKYPDLLAQFPNGIVGSEHTWFAALGANVPTKGEVIPKQELKTAQIAATALKLLNQDPTKFNPHIAPAINEVIE